MTNSVLITVAVGLGLLWLPLWLLRKRGARLSGFDQRTWPKGVNLPISVLDAVRASAGTWVLIHVAPDLPKVAGLGRWQEAAFLGAAIAIGLVIQTLAWRDEDFVFTPVPYLLGIVSAVAHPIVLVIALPLAVGSALALRAWAAGLLAGGAGLAAVGLAVTEQDWRRAVFVGVAICFPVLTSVMAGRHMGWPQK